MTTPSSPPTAAAIRDALSMVSGLLSGSGSPSASTASEIEKLLDQLKAATPQTPWQVRNGLLSSMEAMAVQWPLEELQERVLTGLRNLGWNQDERWPTEASEFGGTPMLFTQVRVATEDGSEKLRVGLRLLTSVSPNRIGGAHLVLEVARDTEGNGLLPGKAELALLQELCKFAVIKTPLETLTAHPSPAGVIVEHFEEQLALTLEAWPVERFELLLNNALSA